MRDNSRSCLLPTYRADTARPVATGGSLRVPAAPEQHQRPDDLESGAPGRDQAVNLGGDDRARTDGVVSGPRVSEPVGPRGGERPHRGRRPRHVDETAARVDQIRPAGPELIGRAEPAPPGRPLTWVVVARVPVLTEIPSRSWPKPQGNCSVSSSRVESSPPAALAQRTSMRRSCCATASYKRSRSTR